MFSLQQSGYQYLKIPMVCCYCNTAIGTLKYTVKKIVKLEKSTRVDRLEFPLCESCRRQYRKMMLIRYLQVFFVVLLTIVIFSFISVYFNLSSIVAIGPVFLELAITRPFYKYLVDPLRPIRQTSNGSLIFHNKDYQQRFESLNFGDDLDDQ